MAAVCFHVDDVVAKMLDGLVDLGLWGGDRDKVAESLMLDQIKSVVLQPGPVHDFLEALGKLPKSGPEPGELPIEAYEQPPTPLGAGIDADEQIPF